MSLRSRKLQELSGVLSEDCGRVLLRRGKPIVLVDGEPIGVLQGKKAMQPGVVEMGGKKHVRIFPGGNPSMESYVRRHLFAFVGGVQKVTKCLLPDIYFAKEYKGPENIVHYIEGKCRDPDVLAIGDFVDADGTPLKINAAFKFGLRQFFSDLQFAVAVCRQAIAEWLQEKKK